MADFPVKISELDKSYSLSANPISILINQRNENNAFETKSLPLSVITQFAKEEAKKLLSGFIDVGTIIPFAGKVLGQESIKGWLLCNGRQVRKDDYPELWNKLGETYGPADNVLFSLPDLKGRIEMGYSHTGESYEPNFGNWPTGEELHLGEGNNANYPDRGEFFHQLKNENIQNHIHSIPVHTHKILNYANMADYNHGVGRQVQLAMNTFLGFRNAEGLLIQSPSINWITLQALSPTSEHIDNGYFFASPGGDAPTGLIASKNYEKILFNRLNYKSNWPGRAAAVKKYVINNPIRTILTYNKDFIDEIKNRKKTPFPMINAEYDNNVKSGSGYGSQGDDQFHSNIQPNVAMNFLIKY
jgi:microcystin-dependent protein